MNHLTEAKRIATEPYARADIAELQIKDINEKDYFAIIAHALIAIAEELEQMNSPFPPPVPQCEGCGAEVVNHGDWCPNCICHPRRIK